MQEFLKADGFDEAIIGYGTKKGCDDSLIYDYEKCVTILIRNENKMGKVITIADKKYLDLFFMQLNKIILAKSIHKLPPRVPVYSYHCIDCG